MKTWLRRDEWMDLSACDGSAVHTTENPGPEECELAASICSACVVRPECIQWAIREKACAVFVAGVYLPEPKFKRELKTMYGRLEKLIPSELKMRGGDV